MGTINITITQTRKYGAVEQTITVNAGFIIESETERELAFGKIQGYVQSAFARFETDNLLTADRATEQTPQIEPHKAGYPVKLEKPKLAISHDGKALRYRVVGGAFHKYGVPVYPEVLEKSDAKIIGLPLGEHIIEGAIVSPDGKRTLELW